MKKWRRPMLRRVRNTAALVILGALASWATAAACAALPLGSYRLRESPDYVASKSPFSVSWMPSDTPLETLQISRPGVDVWWIRSVDGSKFKVMEFWYGWPLRAWRDQFQVGSRITPLTPGIRIRQVNYDLFFLSYSERIPFAPRPLMLVISTAFYTAILALPLSFFPIRRRLRARRGRCPKCGYDLAGLGGADHAAEGAAPCPECGAAAPRAPGARASSPRSAAGRSEGSTP